MSTLHTNDAPTAISRLTDMGLEPFLISSSVRLVIAQRLVRKVCPECKVEQEVKVDSLRELGIGDWGKVIKEWKIYRGKGCEICNQTGYLGRTALFEVMPITPTIAELILKKASAYELKEQAIKEGMSTLRRSGIQKIKMGITTVEEVLRETTL